MKKPMSIPVLSQSLRFPDPSKASPEGLVAIGGDFSQERLLLAYRKGIFPWSINPITWWCPDPRAIIPLAGFHIPRRIRQVWKQGRFRITRNVAFRQVIRECAASGPGRKETWITPPFIEAYTQLHEAGYAHSVECWLGDKLAGGLYGVALGGFFSGESMFYRESYASSVALADLLHDLYQRGFTLFDTQMATAHTSRFGAVHISREHYLTLLTESLKRNPTPIP